jgi:hypothetical protein
MIISKHFGFIALCHLDSSPYIRLNDILDRSVASAQNPGLGARRGKGGGVEVGDASEYQAANVSAVLRSLAVVIFHYDRKLQIFPIGVANFGYEAVAFFFILSVLIVR